MSALDQVFRSSCDRPVGVRKRVDLVIVPQIYRSERYWLIKDPLEMEFYRLNEEEYAVLEMLDGKRSLDEVREQFERRFAPQRITAKQLQQFLSDLHTKSLLAYTNGAVGLQLLEREKEKRWEKFKKNVGSILTIKWRGIDPDRLLNVLTPLFGWIFSPPAVLAAFALMISAGALVLVNYSEFVARLPALQVFLDQRNWLLLISVVAVMKVIHELAHGICFKRYGGECHEIGVMFLLMIPTLYCSTTDSWLLKSKYQRAAIGAAGMYIELIIAALATWAWWFTQPGTLNSLCLNIMTTGSISVVLFNGNPFLKYDGYYILSDLLELPNLRERAAKVTQMSFLRNGLGIEEDAEPNSLPSTKRLLVAYQFGSYLFRALLVGAMLFVMIDRFQWLGLAYFGLALGCLSASALFIPAGFGLYQFFKVPGSFARVQMKHLLVTVAILGITAAVLVSAPVPHYVNCSFTIEPRDGGAVYVDHDAVLKAVHVKPGQTVAAGDLIAELENLETDLQLSKLKAERSELESELELLERTREPSPTSSARLEELKASLATNRAGVQKYAEIAASYRITAPRAGRVIPEWTAARPDGGEELQSWSGSPLADENLGTTLTSGQKLCTIGELDVWDAVLAVNEGDVAFIREKQEVTLMLDAFPQGRLTCSLESMARKQAEHVPDSLIKAKGGSIETLPAVQPQSPQMRPTDEHFEGRVRLPELDLSLSSGLRGTARMRVGERTLYERAMLLLYRNLNKKL